jgi:hypothetical protein
MPKKPLNPFLTVTPPTTAPPEPPVPLAEPGRRLWDAIQAEYRVRDQGGQEMLLLACEASDRLAELRAAIKDTGLMIDGPNGPKANPLLRDEQGTRAFIARSLQRLGVLDAHAVVGVRR